MCASRRMFMCQLRLGIRWKVKTFRRARNRMSRIFTLVFLQTLQERHVETHLIELKFNTSAYKPWLITNLNLSHWIDVRKHASIIQFKPSLYLHRVRANDCRSSWAEKHTDDNFIIYLKKIRSGFVFLKKICELDVRKLNRERMYNLKYIILI